MRHGPGAAQYCTYLLHSNGKLQRLSDPICDRRFGFVESVTVIGLDRETTELVDPEPGHRAVHVMVL